MVKDKTYVQKLKDKRRLKNLLSEYRDEMIANISKESEEKSSEIIDKAIKQITNAIKTRFEDGN